MAAMIFFSPAPQFEHAACRCQGAAWAALP